MDLYVYYRAHSGHAQRLSATVSAMQAELRREHGVSAALKHRPRLLHMPDRSKLSDNPDTWMEVYLAIPNGFENSLQQAVDRAALTRLIDGVRHIEHFQDCTLCV